MQGMAISAATGVRNVAISAELSQFRNLPAQRNFPTLIQGLSGAGPYGPGLAATPAGSVFPGFFRVNRTQLQFGGTADASPIIGIFDTSLTAEAVFQWATNLPGTDQERIGRNPNFGTAQYNGSCDGGYNVCAIDGFATRFAWGYRLLARASFPQGATGIVLQPILLFGQDVNGYAVDGGLVQGRIVIAPLLRAIYQRRYFAEVSGVFLRRNTAFDGVRDRSVYTFAIGTSF